MAIRHNHHIIPLHAGGPDTKDNKVSLSPTRHAMWHFAEWQLNRRWQDKLAWKGLAGYVSHEDCIENAIRKGSENARTQRAINNPEWQKKLQEAAKEACRDKWENDVEWADVQRAHLRKLAKQYGHKGGLASKGKRWWHNELTGETTRSVEQPSPQWRIGKAPLNEESKARQKAAQTGSLFYNDGKISRRFKEPPGNGWVRGRLPRGK